MLCLQEVRLSITDLHQPLSSEPALLHSSRQVTTPLRPGPILHRPLHPSLRARPCWEAAPRTIFLSVDSHHHLQQEQVCQ
ncbi:hypothetical protein J4Q44_G00196130 [Coregonus suidteri]|uniref:Uncharacterized protein n=1 Tax=Coregonus suidteri TaxID=861788 RepID=A0AAN8LJH9_9TELE